MATRLIWTVFLISPPLNPLLLVAQDARVDYVQPVQQQPHQAHPATIWFDDFDVDREYLEPAASSPDMRFSSKVRLGASGRAMESYFARGRRGVGGRKVVFGDAPFGKPIRSGEKFNEIYWRYYVKYPIGWQGGGEAKHSRAIVFNNSRKWTQASILHVWTAGNSLTLDPVRAVREGRVVSTKYNDFANFKWLGNAPRGRFVFHAEPETGRWVCVEVHWKLNTPGKSDGVARLWSDGTLDTERRNMDFRGSYDRHGINAVFLESWWNQGSPVNQARWIDYFAVSTKPIGPVAVSENPTVVPRSSSRASHWQLEVCERASGELAWRSEWSRTAGSLSVNKNSGLFQKAPFDRLASNREYLLRVRERIAGRQTRFSPLHWPILVVPGDAR